MNTNRWIEYSERLYLRLLHLYPQAHRATYEMEMFHVFTVQCRDAYNQRGKLGILLLWLRTFADLIVTIPHEHLIDPQARLGLLEVRPNTPLPWKGVVLVLIPGLIFFVSQIAQVASTSDWFFIAFYRAAFYLIPPVLLVWLLTRRFPVWGLIPLGLLYKILGGFSPHYLLKKIPFFGHRIPDLDPYNPSNFPFDLNYLIPLSACVILLCILMLYNVRRRQISRTAWRWLAVFGLLVVFQIGMEMDRFLNWQDLTWSMAVNNPDWRYYFLQMPLWYLYQSLPFLFLIFLGTFFARAYSGLSFLLILGYLLPTIVFGRYGGVNEALPFAIVSTAVLVYRFVVALVAPVWLVRTASTSKRQRAAAIPVAIAILTHLCLTLFASWATTKLTGYQPGLLDFASIIWGQLILAAGLGLAVALYLPREEAAESPPALVPVTE